MNLIVNGQEIPSEVFQQAMAHLKSRSPQMGQQELAKKATEDIIRHALLRQAATKDVPPVADELVEQEFIRYKKNFPNEAEFRKMLQSTKMSESDIRNNLRNTMRVDIFVDKIAGNPKEPTDAELRAEFEKEPEASEEPAQVTALQLVKTVDSATYAEKYRHLCQVREEILNGADFAAVAKRESDSVPGVSLELGPIYLGQVPEELNAVLFSLRTGEVSPVFQTRFGMQLVKVTHRQAAKKLTFAEARERMRTVLMHRTREANIENWLAAARAKAAVSVKK